MKPFTVLISIAAIALISFGCWGMFTDAGNQKYDEMDGLYPFFALVGGCVLLLIALISFFISLLRSKQKKPSL
jgi:TRAP-type C4-dicarboxylate transport system permease small subunit